MSIADRKGFKILWHLEQAYAHNTFIGNLPSCVSGQGIAVESPRASRGLERKARWPPRAMPQNFH